MRKCDFIVSNSILLRPQYRELLYDDLPKRLGKYSIDTRIETLGMIDILMLPGEEEKESFIWQLESKIQEVEKLSELNPNTPIVIAKIGELNELKKLLVEIRDSGSISRGATEERVIVDGKIELIGQPLGDVFVVIVHLDNEDVVVDRNIKMNGRVLVVDIGQEIPENTKATIKYIKNI